MPKKVELQSTSKQVLYAEFGAQDNLINEVPSIFDNDYDGHARLGVLDFYGMFFPNADTSGKPIMYFRHYDVLKNEYRFANLIELGDDFLSPQKGALHIGEVAGKGTPVNRYHMISKNPLVYGFESPEKKLECRYNSKTMDMTEGAFFKYSAHPWPYTLYDHQSLYCNSSLILQPSTFLGTYEDKPVIGLGSFDRMCLSQHISSFDSVEMKYIALSVMGIREDGRHEAAMISASFANVGKVIAYYYIDGETPVITDHVSIEADWYHLPYVDDGTCVFKDAVFSFCGKTIHFEGKWGTKGFTDKPRIEKHGQSQVFGTWYEGSKPYKHRIYYSFAENMEAYDKEIVNLGFNVCD